MFNRFVLLSLTRWFFIKIVLFLSFSTVSIAFFVRYSEFLNFLILFLKFAIIIEKQFLKYTIFFIFLEKLILLLFILSRRIEQIKFLNVFFKRTNYFGQILMFYCDTHQMKIVSRIELFILLINRIVTSSSLSSHVVVRRMSIRRMHHQYELMKILIPKLQQIKKMLEIAWKRSFKKPTLVFSLLYTCI